MMILSVKKAMDIMDCVACKGKISITELSRELNIPKSTVCQLAQTLEATGYLEQESSSDKYQLSFKFFRIGYDLLEKSGIRSCVRPVIKELADVVGDTVNFTVLDGAKVLFLEKIEGSPLHGGIKEGARGPLHCTASGKVMLANLPPERLENILAEAMPFEVYTPRTIVTLEALTQELAKIRLNGYAITTDELGNGVNSIAAYVQGYPGREAAAVSIAAPLHKFSNERIIELSKLITAAAREISRRFQTL